LPPNQEVHCQERLFGAPKKDVRDSIGVKRAIRDWCASVDGHTLKNDEGKDIDAKMWLIPNVWLFTRGSFWLSAKKWHEAPASSKCGDEVKVREDECVDILTQAMERCDTGSETFGASYAEKCIEYVRYFPCIHKSI
jgi:hypothetical protein